MKTKIEVAGFTFTFERDAVKIEGDGRVQQVGVKTIQPGDYHAFCVAYVLGYNHGKDTHDGF